MSYRHNMLFVQEARTYGSDTFYGIVASVGGKLVCHMCPNYIGKCRHVKLVEEDESDSYAVHEFKQHGSSKRERNKTRCVSKAKIPYSVSTEYSAVLKERLIHRSVYCEVNVCDVCSGTVTPILTQRLAFVDWSDIGAVDGKRLFDSIPIFTLA